MSVIMAAALDVYGQMRDDFELHRNAEFMRAHEAVRGVMLNRRGRDEAVDPYSLFMGTATRAIAFASEDLLRYWIDTPRPTLSDFERQWMAARGGAL